MQQAEHIGRMLVEGESTARKEVVEYELMTLQMQEVVEVQKIATVAEKER